VSKSISVTEVRNALRCPRLFVLGRLRGQQVAFPVGSSLLGATFHRILESFARSVDSPPPELLRASTDGEVGAAVGAWLMGYLVRELAATSSLTTMPAEVDDLAEALRALSRFLANGLITGASPPAEALAQLVHHGELPVETIVDSDGETVRLTGRIDALYASSRGELDVVEYKLTEETNDELDRAQVSLYRYLLREHRALDASPVILRFNPELTVTRLSADEADALVEQRLLPLVRDMIRWSENATDTPPTERPEICPACPLRDDCAAHFPSYLLSRDGPPAGALRPQTTAGGDSVTAARRLSRTASLAEDVDARKQSDEVKASIEKVLRSLGVAASLPKPATIGPRLLGLEVSAGRGRVAALDRAANDVIHKLRSEHDTTLTYENRGGLRRFWVVRRSPRPVTLSSLFLREELWLSEKPGRFVLGETAEGGVLRGDLRESTLSHILVGGTTGSGKSVLLKVLAASLAQFQPPAALQLTLIDPKRVTFGPFRASLASHLAHPLCFDVGEALGVLEGLADEMERRYERFDESAVETVDEYNDESAEDPLPRHVVIIDEFQDLLVDKATRVPFETVVHRLGSKARGAGIHLVLATQRPDAKTVSGVIKANMPGRIALRVRQKVNSQIILGQAGAEELLGEGDLIADLGLGLVRAQGAMLG
jgi:S-DNA-T family DNA segregation ATPase FtsK/SpoIIIE